MITMNNDNIEEYLKRFNFLGYAKTTAYLLKCYDISDTTISKIVDRINKGDSGPFYIYRRAVLYCGNFNSDEISKKLTSAELTICFTPKQVILFNKKLGSAEFQYESVCQYLEYLKPLNLRPETAKDHYKTLELDSLIESLYRSLILDDNDASLSRRFIIDMLYIALINSIFGFNEIVEHLTNYKYSIPTKFNNIYSLLRKNGIQFITNTFRKLNISEEAFRYASSVLKFDMNSVDAELLTSLVYRIIDNDEVGIFGHQTSFENVDKIICPLFFDELKERFESSTANNVESLVSDILNTVIFDPTNGPGCFLVASYCRLTQLLYDIEDKFGTKSQNLNLNNFIGLVDNSVSRELSVLAMATVHMQELNRAKKIRTCDVDCIVKSIKIYLEDELNSDWNQFVQPKQRLFIIGSPEFKGSHKLAEWPRKKEAMQRIFRSSSLFSADFCSTWLIKAAHFICGTEAKAAFVLTNSVSQGAQATFISDKVREAGCEYYFANRSFKWKTAGADNAGVSVVIIGISSIDTVKDKTIIDNGEIFHCNLIGPNLLPDLDTNVKGRSKPLSPILPEMKKGNMAYAKDLLLTSQEVEKLLEESPNAKQFIRPFYGSEEFVHAKPRWCLWITDNALEEANKIKGIEKRIELVRQERANSKATSVCKANPHKFRDTNTTSAGQISLIVPCVTSEHRQYFQIGILDEKAIVSNLACVIYDCDIWLLSLLESRMHKVWATSVCGKHESRPRYSCRLCYNTFPVPQIDNRQINNLSSLSKTLIEVREKYCNKSLAELYNNMPPELLRVHSWIDVTVDSIYRSQPFEDDVERLDFLLIMYNKMIKYE